MRYIENDLKRRNDEMNEYKATYSQFVKKEGANYLTKDLGELIYDNTSIDQHMFVETHESEMMCSVIAIVGKGQKYENFMSKYETCVKDCVVPRSAKRLNVVEDKDGYSLYLITVFKTHVDQYITAMRGEGITVRKFVYDVHKYKQEKEKKVLLEDKIEKIKVSGY